MTLGNIRNTQETVLCIFGNMYDKLVDFISAFGSGKAFIMSYFLQQKMTEI